MGRVIKQSAGNALSNYLGVAIGAVNLLILYPRAFEDQPEYFGLVQLIISYGLVVATFTNLGVPNMIIRYFPELEKENRPKLLGFGLLYPIPVLVLLFLLIWGFQEKIIPLLNDEKLFLDYWWYIIPLVLFNVYFEILASIANSYFKTQLPLFLKEVERRLVLSILLLVYWAGWIDLQIFLLLYVVSILLQLSILLFYLIKREYLSFSWSVGSLSKRPMVIYGGYLLFTSGFNLLVNKIDTLMIGSFIDLESVAYYSIAFFIGGILNVPGKSLVHVTKPVISNAFARERLDEVERIYKATAINLLVIGTLLFTLLITSLDDLFFLLPEDYRKGKLVVFLIALAQLVNISAGQNGIVIAFSRFYKFNLYALIFFLTLTVINNIIFIPLMGIEGAALATLISFVLFNIIKTIFVKLKLGMLPYEPGAWKVFPLFLVIFTAGYFFNIDVNPIVEIILRSGIVIFIFLLFAYFLNISDDINRIIKKAWDYVV